jgi:hypothetical protein
MNIKLSRQEIRSLLDRSADQLNRSALDGLHAARQHALQRQRASMSAWLGRDGALHGHLQLSQHSVGWIAAAVVTTLLLLNLTYCYHSSEHDHGDIDIAILTDDMPVDVYVD